MLERGGLNLYSPLRNNPIGSVDALGLLSWSDFNPLLLFDTEAWGSWIYDQAVPKPACPFDKDSNLRMLAGEGHEVSQFEDADGRPISGGRLVAGVAGVVVVSTLSAVVDGAGSAGKGGKAAAQANHAKCAKGPPSLTAHKNALAKVHEEVGRLPKGKPGKFGSPQAGDSVKGYRLDPPHPDAAPGTPEAGPHINWWDWTDGKRGKGGRSGAIPIEE